MRSRSRRKTLAELQADIRRFVDAREWRRFHSPKNLSMALAVEAAELMEIFQWMTAEESRALPPKKRSAAADEVGDVLLLALNLAQVLEIDPAAAVSRKLRRAARKYPVHRYRGRYE